ncbi:GNAT family protein [Microbacterium sp. H1-D42]|uniref:GNAT family N-acetyltransferase n=1 Tax=Microbacterium sp. H1-D42 TaxID=2925844 RepID=UPI001F52F7BF|nr:GNAT family protein [Microbacterium sp. H1-D42]UNK69299.1 GNAT family N-acetyltransferase [Microbacterium sp. H1-D42]
MDLYANPTIVGEWVTLRGYTDDDVALVASVVDDPLIPLITTVPPGGDGHAILEYIERQRSRASNGEGFQFVIVDNASGDSVGQVGLTFREPARARASAGYWIAPQHRRRGYAADALREVSRWAIQDLSVQRLELYVEPQNEGSIRTAEKAGYLREALLRSWMRVGSARVDMYMYALLGEGHR